MLGNQPDQQFSTKARSRATQANMNQEAVVPATTNRRRPCRSEGSHVRLSARRRPTEPNPVKIPTKAMTLCLPRDLVARPAGRSVAPPAASPGRRSQATETESGCEESGQRPRGASAGARERETAAARNPARPKRRQAAETAGEERSGGGGGGCGSGGPRGGERGREEITAGGERERRDNVRWGCGSGLPSAVLSLCRLLADGKVGAFFFR